MCLYMSAGAHRGQRYHILQELQALVSGYWESNCDLQEHYVLLISELSLQPHRKDVPSTAEALQLFPVVYVGLQSKFTSVTE